MGFSYMVTPYDYEVLLATHNGVKYLEEQLDSIASQTIPPRRIIISDDCSSDNTIRGRQGRDNTSTVHK